jgi:hypothetical protein
VRSENIRIWSINAERNFKHRTIPYSIAGLLVGGILGYFYYDQVDETPSDEDWGAGAVVYPMLGASIGAAAGTVLAYLTDH